MKKIGLGFILALAMLAMLVPCAYAYGMGEVDETQTVPAGAFNAAVVNKDGALAPADEATSMEEDDFPQETQQDNNDDIKRFKERKRSAYKEADDVSLMSADDEITISGTITLPEPAQADGYISIDPIGTNKRDGNKVLNSFEVGIPSHSFAYLPDIEVKKGEREVSYSANIKKGVYAIKITCKISGNIRNLPMYYSVKGAALNIADADVLELNSDRQIDITFPKAERTISGTITLETPVPEDDFIHISCENFETYYYNSYISIPVKKGQTETDYSIGVDKGAYILSVNLYDDFDKNYSVMGTADVNNPYYLNVKDKSLDNMDFTYLYKYEEDNRENKIYAVPVTVTLPQAASKDITYDIYGYTPEMDINYEIYTSCEVHVNEGESIGSGEVYIDENTQFTLSINVNGIDYYYTAQGVSPNKEDAAYIYGDKNTSVNFDLTDFIAVNGMVSRNGTKQGDAFTVNVAANVGEYTFEDNTTINENAEASRYFIVIPNSLKGTEYEIYAAVSGMGKYADLRGEAVTGVVSQNMNNINVAVKNLFTRMTGKVVFSEPVERGGVDVTISSTYSAGSGGNRYYDVCKYCIREGEAGFEYEIDILGNAETAEVTFQFDGLDRRFNMSKSVTINKNEYNILEIAVPENDQKITGYIEIPDTVDMSNAVSYTIQAYYYKEDGESEYAYVYDTMPKGETRKSYSIEVPSNATLYELCAGVDSSGIIPIAGAQYEGPDGYYLEIPLTNGLTDANITLEKEKGIYGKIIVPQDDIGDGFFANVFANVSIYVYSEYDGFEASAYLNISDGETPYMIVVPEDYTGDVKLLCRFEAGDNYNLYDGIMYYAGDIVACEEENAQTITIADKNINNIDLRIVPYKTMLTVNMSGPACDKVDFDNIDLTSCMIFDDECWIDPYMRKSEDGNSITAEFTVPDTIEYKDKKVFKLFYSLRSDSGDYIYNYGNMYVNPDGTYTTDEEKAVWHTIRENHEISVILWDNSFLTKDAFESGDVTVSAANANATSNRCQADLQYQNNSDNEYTATALVAAYKQGVLVGLKEKQINILSGSNTESLDFSFDEPADDYKILLWNNTSLISPLIDAKNVPVSE